MRLGFTVVVDAYQQEAVSIFAAMCVPAQTVSLGTALRDPAIVLSGKEIPGVIREGEEDSDHVSLIFAVSEDEEFTLEYSRTAEEENEIILQETEPDSPEFKQQLKTLQEESGKETVSASFWQLSETIGGEVTLSCSFNDEQLSENEEICILRRTETGEYEESEATDEPEDDTLKKIVLKTVIKPKQQTSILPYRQNRSLPPRSPGSA